MNHVPTNRIRFWTCYAIGTFGPISVNFLLNQFRRPFDDGADFAAELPRFQAAVWEIFNPYELRGYVASLKPAARKKLQKLLYVTS
jgi:hypothetical protein